MYGFRQNFHEFEDLAAKSEQDFLGKLMLMVDSEGLEEAIRMIKVSGICVDIYGGGRSKKLFQKAMKYLNETFGKENVNVIQLAEEVRILNALFATYHRFKIKSGVEAMSLPRQLLSYLMTLEMFLGASIAYLEGQNLHQIKKKYPFVVSVKQPPPCLALRWVGAVAAVT